MILAIALSICIAVPGALPADATITRTLGRAKFVDVLEEDRYIEIIANSSRNDKGKLIDRSLIFSVTQWYGNNYLSSLVLLDEPDINKIRKSLSNCLEFGKKQQEGEFSETFKGLAGTRFSISTVSGHYALTVDQKITFLSREQTSSVLADIQRFHKLLREEK